MRSVTSPVSLCLLHSNLFTGCTDILAAVALALYAYDYMLTFSDEVQYIWRRPVTGIKILYLILRYGVLFAEIVYFQGERFSGISAPKFNISLAYTALSGLAPHLSHSVCILLFLLFKPDP